MNVLPTLLPGFTGTTLPGWLRDRLRSGLGGVTLFARNIASPEGLRALTDDVYAANPGAVVAVDEEGGDVTRLFAQQGSPYPGNAVLGRIDDLDLTRRVAEEVGWALRRVGCNVTYAPCVDVNVNADNPVIGVRSFGAAAELVARHSAAWTSGLQATGVAAAAKHFPGHGDTADDSHVSLPVLDRSRTRLLEREIVPFAAAFEAGARLVMTSHIVVAQVDGHNPATMSEAVLTGLLREELGFSGVVVSDALDMVGASSRGGLPEAAVRALSAGCDLLCLGNDNTDAQLAAIEHAVDEAVKQGRLGADRVDDAARRGAALTAGLAATRAAVPVPPPGAGAAGPSLDRVVGAFDVQPGATAWRDQDGPYAVVRIASDANIAVGASPWGPFAEVAADPASPGSAGFAARPLVEVTPSSPDVPTVPEGPRVLVVGRDVHRHAFARQAVDRLRARGAPVLVVDMGWPSQDRGYADVATFGASRLMGRALLAWLDRRD